MMSTYSKNTSGFDQFTSHCHELNVVQTHACIWVLNVKLPGAKVGNISGSVFS